MDVAQGLIALIVMAVIVVVVFLVCREIVCWYWKINEGLVVAKDLLEEQKTTNTLLRQAHGIKVSEEVPKKVPTASGQEY